MRDDGLPIAYEALQTNTPVYGNDDVVMGVVARVIAEPELDIFHGLMIRTEYGARFVEADYVRSLHERSVELTIPSSDAEGLPVSD